MHRIFFALAFYLCASGTGATDRKAFEAYCTYVGQTYAYAAALRDAGLSEATVVERIPPVRALFAHGTTARMHRDDIHKLFDRPQITPTLAYGYWRDGCLERESPP